ADLDLGRDVLGDLRAEAEGLVLWKEPVPLFSELGIVRKVVPLPVFDGVVVLLRQHAYVVFHTSRVRGRPRPRSVQSVFVQHVAEWLASQVTTEVVAKDLGDAGVL